MIIIDYSNNLTSYVKNNSCDEKQTHTHEVLGSVKIAKERTNCHNHRFAVVTGQVIPLPGGNHKHELKTRTDFYENHFHIIRDVTGPAIKVGDRHVHFVKGDTTINDQHSHEYIVGTLINDPIGN